MDATALIQATMAQNGMSPQPSYTPGTPSFNPALGPVSPPPMPQGPPGMGSPPAGQAMPKGQDEIIVQALIKQLERIDKQKQMGVV